MRALIWILEDDTLLAFLFKQAFATMNPSPLVRLFEDGESALLAKGSPDIIIADTCLAGKLTGPEVVERLRERLPQLAVVFSSSLRLPPHVTVRARDAVLPKPFSVVRMVELVKVMIREVPRLHFPLHPPALHARKFRRH